MRLRLARLNSDELAFTSDELLASGALRDASTDPYKYSNFRTGEGATELLARNPSIVREQQPRIREIVDAFGDFDPSTLELLSTMHFVDQRLKAGGSNKPERWKVLNEFRKVKGNKFRQEQLEKAFDALEAAGLVA